MRKRLDARRHVETEGTEPQAEQPAAASEPPHSQVDHPAETSSDDEPRSDNAHRPCHFVGYGRVGSIVGENLISSGTPFLVIEDSDKRIGELKQAGIEAIYGNAASAEIARSMPI